MASSWVRVLLEMSEVLHHVPFFGRSDRLRTTLFVFEKNPLAVLGHGHMR